MTWGRDRGFRARQRAAVLQELADKDRRLADREERLTEAHAALRDVAAWRDDVVECCEVPGVTMTPDGVADVAAVFDRAADALNRALTPEESGPRIGLTGRP